MKRFIFTTGASLLIGLSTITPAFAQTTTPDVTTGVTRGAKITKVVERMEAKISKVQERITTTQGKMQEKISQAVDRLKKLPRAAFGTGKVTAINGTTITGEKDGKTYTILTGTFDKCTTKFKRHFFGDGSLAEIKVGHMINVVGRWTDEAKTTIEACLIRDISIQKRFGVFVGKVESVSTTGFVMTTVGDKRQNQTVTTNASTKFIDRKNQTIALSDIKVGDRVRVRGMWDRSDNTVTEVTEVKDYGLPPLPTKRPSSTPTP